MLPSTTTHHQPKYIYHHPPRPTTITTTHHEPKYIHHHPPPAKIYQPTHTTTHHQLKYINHHPPPPEKWTTSQQIPKNIRIPSFWHCFSSFFFFKMQYSFPWRRFCVIKFWSVCFSNSKFLLHFTIFKIFKVLLSILLFL